MWYRTYVSATPHIKLVVLSVGSVQGEIMRARSTWTISIVFSVILLLPTQLFAAVAAKVQFIWGSAVAVTTSGTERELAKGSSIEVGDTVMSKDARLQLRFTDGGLVSLAPHSEFRVNAYSYSGAPDGSERIAMELIRGGLRTISGLIGKAIKEAYEMKTAIATIGIRGTEYTVVYGESISGTVAAGAIAVCNAGGCLDVLHGQSYQVADGNTRPVLISKAALLPPPPPAKGEKKQSAQTDMADRRAPNKFRLSARDTKLTDMRDGGGQNDDPKYISDGGPQNDVRRGPDENAQVSGVGGHEKKVSPPLDRTLQNISTALDNIPEAGVTKGKTK